jgi:CDP-diacylglycerol---glycerol-3-phosphate 3-phosphatidyltransferase
MFTKKFQAWVRRLAERLVGSFRDSPVTPNMLTLFGLLITAGGAGLVAAGQLFLGGLVLLFAGLFDILDGALARAANKVYRYGAFLDSTVDRYSEGVVYLGLLVFYLAREQMVEPILILCALAGSFLVSYVRARAQSLGYRCDAGILQRPERVVIIVAALLLYPLWDKMLTVALVILAVGTNVTAVQRVWEVWRQNRVELSTAREVPPQRIEEEPIDRPVRAAMRRFFALWSKT